MNGITKAVTIFGGQSLLARAVNVSPQAIKFWLDGKRLPQLRHCVRIEQETQGQVTCEEIRPDLADCFQYLRRRAA